MNKDTQNLSEAYSRIYVKEDEDFREQMPTSKEVYDKEELGPDPKDLAQYDDYEKARKDINYDNYTAWDAYHAVKEGAWSEDDFLQWMRSVWADGANNA
jgi:hypothetical protein